jgi:hypothetical protein
MNSAEKKPWIIALAGPARKSLKRIPPKDWARIRAAIDEMESNPLEATFANSKGAARDFGGAWVIGVFSSISIQNSAALS